MQKESKAKILTHNSAYVYLGKIVTQFFGFIVSILVIRKLSVEVYGAFNFLVATFFVFRILSVSPFANIFNRYIPEFVAKKDFFRLKRFIINSFAVSSLAFFILILLTKNLQEPFSRFFHIQEFSQYLLPFIFYLFFRFLLSLSEMILTSLLLHKSLAVIRITRAAISPAVYLYFLPILNVNIMLLIEGFFASVIVIPSLFITFRYIRQGIQTHGRLTEDYDYKKRIFRYGLLSAFDQVGTGIVGRTSDYFIISAIGSQHLVGLYAFAYKIYNMVEKVFPLREFLTVVRPLFFQKYSEKFDSEKFTQMNNFMIKMILPVHFIPFVFFFIFGKPIIQYIYDPKYLDAYWVTCIVLLSPVLTSFFFPNNMLIKLFEKMEIFLFSKVIIVFSIFAGIYAMKFWGVIGVAVATTIGNFAQKLFMYLLMRRYVVVRFRFREMLNYLYISLFLIGIFYLLQYLINSILILIFFSALFFLVLFILGIFFHPFNKEDLHFLYKITSSSKILKKLSPIIVKIHQLKPAFLT